jgi:hypothetical protein
VTAARSEGEQFTTGVRLFLNQNCAFHFWKMIKWKYLPQLSSDQLIWENYELFLKCRLGQNYISNFQPLKESTLPSKWICPKRVEDECLSTKIPAEENAILNVMRV